MTKRTLLLLSGICLLPLASLASDDSLILLNTKKTIEATRPKPNSHVDPKHNMTDIIKPQSEEPTDIYFSADEMENDAENGIITAKGAVEIIRENITLRADKVVYDQKKDKINAEGNVVLLDDTGNVMFADKIDLSERMQNADVANIKVVLSDKTRMAANSFHKKVNDKKVLRQAIYTPCDNCRGESPLWQLKADKVIHDPKDQNIEYQNAFLEVKGVPVLYSPYFSHPDPSVKHRSGFLFPRLQSSNYLGAAIQPQYFWDISPHENFTFNPILSSDKGIIYSGILNKYFYRGELNASGTFLRDEDDDKNRGNLFLYGRYEINDYWVADTDINYASDHNYLKDLSLPKKDDSWLTSRVRLQAFDNRNYAAIEGYYYDMLSYNLQNRDTPYVIPLMSYENISSPDKYGAYFKNTFNTASVYHDDEDTSSQRVTMINSWNLPYTSPYGEKYRLVASVKSDLYYINKYLNDEGEEFSGATGRIFPQLGLEWRLPFVKNTQTTSQILEPIIVAAVSPNNDNNPEKIPNTDSRDVEITDVNIFDLDRYSGYDRNDTGSRVSYGLNWSFYGKKWGRSSLLLAQTYEFDKDNDLFNTSDENSHFSDYVGRMYAAPNEYFDINYRFKIDKEDFGINYSELSSSLGTDMLRLYVSYILFPEQDYYEELKELYPDYFDSRREEIYLSLSSKVTRNWSVDVFTRQDMVNNETISNGGGFAYEDECSRVAFHIEKEYSDDPDSENDFNLYLSFYLKTLGGVGTN